MQDPAPKRQVDEDYKQWVTRFPCIASGKPADDPNHLDSQGSGGSDYTVVPMTRGVHTQFHKMPLSKFEKRWGVNTWRAAHQLTRRYFAGKHNHNDREFLYWLHGRDCIIEVEPSDVITRLTGPRGNDYTAVPMTENAYDQYVALGHKGLERRWKVNLWRESHKLLRTYFTDATNPTR